MPLQFFLGSELVNRVRTVVRLGQSAQGQGTSLFSGSGSGIVGGSDIDRTFPYSYVKLPNGKVFFTNGWMRMRKWNVHKLFTETVGVLPPTSELVLNALLADSLDRNKILDEPIFKSFVIFGSGFGSSAVVDAISDQLDDTYRERFAKKGLTPAQIEAELDKIIRQRTAIAIAKGETDEYFSGNYTAYLRFVDGEGNVSNVSPISQELEGFGLQGIRYTNVQSPTEDKVKLRQILRNTSGQAGVYYVDIETSDLTSTELVSYKRDIHLLGGEAVPFFDDSGIPLVMRNGIPPNHKPYLAYYKDRLWLGGEVVYSTGHLQVTAGSTTVTGVGTGFVSAMKDRFLYITGSREVHEIAAVSESAQTLTISPAWKGATDAFATYKIQSPPAERANIYFSEPGLYEAWNPFGGLTLDSQSEPITALLATDAFLYIAQERLIWRITFKGEPYRDGAVFEAVRRGCINHRSWVRVEGLLYILDHEGIYSFDGGDEVKPISLAIDDLFDPDHPRGKFRINWQGSRFFHAHYDRVNGVLRWFVCLSGYRPRHALCYQLANQAWWIEEYPYPILDSATWESGLTPVPIVVSRFGKVYAMNRNTLDGPVRSAGTTRGTVTSATSTTITDAFATFASSGIAGNPILITGGKGKGQRRLVVAVSGQTLTVKHPWLETPDATSTYQLGGFNWQWRSKVFRWLPGGTDQARRLEMIFSPCQAEAEMAVQFYRDHAETPEDFGVDWPPTPAESDGVEYTKDEPEAVVDLTLPKGFAQIRVSDNRNYYTERGDFLEIDLSGGSSAHPILFHELSLEGVEE